MTRTVVVALLLFLSIHLPAQQGKQYSFKSFSVVNGLASNTVSAVVQDADGYMWIATANGLQRYDGSDFITFKSKSNEAGAIPPTYVSKLFVDSKKRLWLAVDNKIMGRFDTKKFTFKAVPIQTQKEYFIQKIYELQSGELLMLNFFGNFFRYDERQDRFVEDSKLVPLPAGWKCTDISWDQKIRKYWLSCDSGLVLFDPVSRNISYKGHNPDTNPVIAAIGHIPKPAQAFTDNEGNVLFQIWPPLAGQPTFYKFTVARNRLDSFFFWNQLSYHEIWGSLKQRNGRTWLYGHPFFGEWQTDQNKLNVLSLGFKGDEMKFDYAHQVFEDREGNIWIATDNGVYLFNPDAQIFNTYKLIRPGGTPMEANVQAVSELSDGRIFIGCWGAGLFVFDRNFNPLPLPAPLKKYAGNYSVWDMAVHSRTGALWATLQGGGLLVYDRKKEKLTEMYPDIFKAATIRQIDEDTSGNFWFGTQHGRVIKWDYKKSGGDPTKGFELICETGLVHKIHFDYQGYIYVATLHMGLLKIDTRTNKVVKIYTDKGKEGERLFMNSPGDMTYFNDTTLLVTAGCINIVNTKTNKISFLSAENGLPSNTVESIQKDRNGIVWVGMTNGFCRVNLPKKIVSYYDRRDGISFDKFEQAGVEQLKDGRMIFFTDHNFLVFDPKHFVQQSNMPKPYITAFKLGGNSLSLDSLKQSKRVVLQYNNTSITINFSALSYLQQRKLHFYYKMENLDKDWIHVDRPEAVVYNYLSPGDYTFKVKCENADGSTSEETASVSIEVRPPFWKSWWFYSLIILLAILVMYIIDRERVQKMRSLQQVRTQIAGNLSQEINTALNNINVLSEIAKIKVDRDANQSKEFIDQISDKSRHMIESLDDMMWSIHPENDSMRQTLSRIREITDNIMSTNEVDIDLIVDHQLQSLNLDMKLRYELFFFYKDAITFIVESIECSQLFVNFALVKNKLLLEILSECGVEIVNFETRFRKTVQRRVAEMNGALDVTADNRNFSIVLSVTVR